MKISICTTMTNPEARKDPWKEALECYKDLADEVIITGEDWKYDFSWDDIGKFFQEGFNKASGDWVLRMDLDYFFRKNDFIKIKNFLDTNKNEPAVAFPQYQIFSHDRYQLKTKLCIALNKKNFPNIKLNGGGDLCQPTLNGKQVKHSSSPVSRVPLFQYDSVFRTKDIIAEDRARFARAWYKYFKNYGDRGGASNEEAFNAWFTMVKQRYNFHIWKLKLTDHPTYIRDRLSDIQPDQFGYDVFGLKKTVKRKPIHYYKGLKQKLL